MSISGIATGGQGSTSVYSRSWDLPRSKFWEVDGGVGLGGVGCMCQLQTEYVYLASGGFAPDPPSGSAPRTHWGTSVPKSGGHRKFGDGGPPSGFQGVSTLLSNHGYAIHEHANYRLSLADDGKMLMKLVVTYQHQ